MGGELHPDALLGLDVRALVLPFFYKKKTKQIEKLKKRKGGKGWTLVHDSLKGFRF
jgi:hypothetical protein